MRELLVDAFHKMQMELSEEQIDKFLKFYDLLVEKNKVMNLTAITEPEDVVYKHYVDSIALLKYVSLKKDSKILDLGTGAGFPGIPLAIMCPDCSFVLMDSLNKRINFINEVLDACGITNVKAVHGRAEEYARQDDYRERFDFVVSRAVANLSVLLEYCIPFVSKKGKFISYKSGKIEDELESSKSAQKKLGCEKKNIYLFQLPEQNSSRSFVVFDKKFQTPWKYPRQAGKPTKNPL